MVMAVVSATVATGASTAATATGATRAASTAASAATVAPDPGGANSGFTAPTSLAGKRFGFTSHLAEWTSGSGVTAVQETNLIANAGGTVQRYAFSWRWLQPKAGGKVIFPAWADLTYRSITSRGMTPIITFLDAPTWATRFASCGLLDLTCILARAMPQKAPAGWAVGAFAKVVAAVAARYPLAVIEPWNEPNESAFWHDGWPGGIATLNPGRMAQMQCAVYDRVKALAGPERIVLSPGVGVGLASNANTMGYADYMSQMYKAMGRVCWDHLDVHIYNNGDYAGPGTMLAAQMQTIRQTSALFGDPSSIWVSETGMSTSGCGRPGGCATEQQQTQWQVAGVYKLLTMPDVDVVLVHNLRDAPSPAEQLITNISYGYGMLRAGRGPTPAPKPAYCWYVQFEHHKYQGC
ncbi:MAG TPA: hypothetical protein VHA73_13290 [Acidimicrobiales bacterium]|nr:hypothetical protein [Acidimicrobiales bacterium]